MHYPNGNSNVDNVQQQNMQPKGRSFKPNKAIQKQYTYMDNRDKCTRCGFSPWHPRDKCPAKAASCNKCQMKGHFAKMCRSKISHIKSHEAEDNAMLGMVKTQNSNPWRVHLSVNQTPIQFKLDTGADESVISFGMYKEYLGGNSLETADEMLWGPGQNKMDVAGMIPVTLSYKGKDRLDDIYVINDLTEPLLSRKAIEYFGLIVRVDEIRKIDNEGGKYKMKHPKLFSGLVQMAHEYTIKLKPNAKPTNVTAPRRVPLPLRDKVKTEIQRMESLRVISKVTEPTEWCSGMVVVPKPS